jgi:hypothetical protein
MEVKMDNVLRNDLALLFQLVSEKEKKRNHGLKFKTKKIVDTFLKLNVIKKKEGKNNNEKQ